MNMINSLYALLLVSTHLTRNYSKWDGTKRQLNSLFTFSFIFEYSKFHSVGKRHFYTLVLCPCTFLKLKPRCLLMLMLPYSTEWARLVLMDTLIICSNTIWTATLDRLHLKTKCIPNGLSDIPQKSAVLHKSMHSKMFEIHMNVVEWNKKKTNCHHEAEMTLIGQPCETELLGSRNSG